MNTNSMRLRRVLVAAAGSLTVAVIITACSSGSKTAGGGSASTSGSMSASMSSGLSMSPGGAPASGSMMIDVKNFSFAPMDITVAVGTKVTWKFDDSAAHTVKAEDGSFASPALHNGQTYDFTFTKAGTYKYICSIHQYMNGTVTVK